MNKNLKEIQDRLEELKSKSEAIDNEIDGYHTKIVALDSEQDKILVEMEKLAEMLGEED